MTRKRFVRLMMADGYSRNDALEIAERVQGAGSYDQTYLAIHSLNGAPSLQEAVEQLAETCGCILRAFADALEAFTRTFNKSMEAYRKNETEEGT